MNKDIGVQIWEPTKGRLYDTESNLNYVDLTEPFEVYASPVYPKAFSGRGKTDPVRYFRKVALFQEFPEILDYFAVDNDKEVRLRKHKGDEKERYHQFSLKMKYIISTYASKSKIKKYMIKISSTRIPMTQTQFFKKVYRCVRKSIRKHREKKFG